MSVALEPVGRAQRVAWRAGDGQRHRGDLLLLAPWAERELNVAVGKRQAALLLRDRAVARVLSEGEHRLSVGPLSSGWARPREEAIEILPGEDRASSDDLLFYLSLEELPAIPFELSEGQGALAGHAILCINDPARAYDAFFRNSEDLDEAPFIRICNLMVLGIIRRWAAARGGLPAMPIPVLADELRIATTAALAGVGLDVDRFEIAEAAADPLTVVGDWETAMRRD